MPSLRIHRGDQVYGEVELTDRDVRIGRGDQNDVKLEDATKAVSRFHAELRAQDGKYHLVDQNSQNGLWSAGRQHAKITLEPNQPVTLGPYTLTLIDMPRPPAAPQQASATPLPTTDTLVQPRRLWIQRATAVGHRTIAATLWTDSPKPLRGGSKALVVCGGGFVALASIALAIVLFQGSGEFVHRAQPVEEAATIGGRTATPVNLPGTVAPQHDPPRTSADSARSTTPPIDSGARTGTGTLFTIVIGPSSLGYVNVRQKPNSASSVIATVAPGEKYNVASVAKGWYLIQGDKQGWIAGRYVLVER